jgi:hypothetical protein
MYDIYGGCHAQNLPATFSMISRHFLFHKREEKTCKHRHPRLSNLITGASLSVFNLIYLFTVYLTTLSTTHYGASNYSTVILGEFIL